MFVITISYSNFIQCLINIFFYFLKISNGNYGSYGSKVAMQIFCCLNDFLRNNYV